ncbi:MAG: hypothetical protein LBU32_15695 [Clostridiales bacterium]|jgi:predicted Zn-dependent peptidase|nr:hypothetical protein [Clostridiales bacterium]
MAKDSTNYEEQDYKAVKEVMEVKEKLKDVNKKLMETYEILRRIRLTFATYLISRNLDPVYIAEATGYSEEEVLTLMNVDNS